MKELETQKDSVPGGTEKGTALDNPRGSRTEIRDSNVQTLLTLRPPPLSTPTDVVGVVGTEDKNRIRIPHV